MKGVSNLGKPSFQLLRHSSRRSFVTYEKAVSNLPETQLTQLNNGVRIVSESNSSPACSISLCIDAGTRYENERNNGIAHLFEHMLLKGTGTRSASEIEKSITDIGAQVTSKTTPEYTVIQCNVLSKNASKLLEIIADVIHNSTFSTELVEAEKGVLLRELSEIETDWPRVVMDYLHQTAYQGTPLALPLHGPSVNIKAFSRQDILEYIDNNFKGPRIVLSAAGGVNHDQLAKLGEQYFGKVSTTYPAEIPVLTPCRFTGSEMRIRDDAVELAHVAIAVEGPGKTSEDYLDMEVAAILQGNWDKTLACGQHIGSLLAQEVSKQNYAVGFQSFNKTYSDTGLWGIYYVADRMTLDDMTHQILEEWMRMCSSASDFQVERAKNILKTRLLADYDSLESNAETMGKQVLYYGRRVPWSELEAKINAINAKSVRAAGMKYIYDNCPSVVGYGPIEALTDYNRVRSNMYWLRF